MLPALPSSSSSSSILRLFIFIVALHVTGGLATPKMIQYRAGVAADTLPIAWQLGRELMNPLDIQANRFVVACDGDRDRIGWAQIKPLGGREDAVQRETDDVMWDEFEADQSIQVPVGWQSLPWTREYKEFSKQAEKRRQRQAVQKEVETETPTLYELASVWVDPAYRGRGIGTELVRQVLQRHVTLVGPLENVYLLTLGTTTDWYHDNFGFAIVPTAYVPEQMAFEVKAGKVITSVLGKDLVCMQGNSDAFDASNRNDKKRKDL